MADLDGDGRLDLVTGSFDGGAYWLRGLEGGGFAAPEEIRDSEGGVLRAGMYWQRGEDAGWRGSGTPHGVSAAPIDLDGDGLTDLVIGTSKGALLVSMNCGTRQAPRFLQPQVELKAGESAFRAPGGYAMPFAADWDGDGRIDLVVGAQDGSVLWLRNTGEPGEPRFEAPVELVGPSSKEWDQPGQRAQVAVADWDGDGHADLLVGDFLSRKVDGKNVYRGHVWLYRRIPPAASHGLAEGAGGGE